MKANLISIATAVLICTGCAQDKSWSCKTEGKAMYSINDQGEWASAEKGCSCEQIRAFEQQTFGEIDEDAMKRDFGC